MDGTTGQDETRYDNSEALRLLAAESEGFAPDHQGADVAAQELLKALVAIGQKTAVRITPEGENAVRLVAHDIGVSIIHRGYGEFAVQIAAGEKKQVNGLRFDLVQEKLVGDQQEDKLARPGDPPRYRSASAVLVEAALETIRGVLNPAKPAARRRERW